MFNMLKQEQTRTRTRPLKVLLVDDELSTQKMVGRRLEASGYQVLLAGSGRLALELARDQSPDVIVMDIMMPDMSGDDAAFRLKNDERTARIPIIFLTCLVQPNEASESNFKAGENMILPKPMDSGQLISTIEKVVGR